LKQKRDEEASARAKKGEEKNQRSQFKISEAYKQMQNWQKELTHREQVA
jgi:hypothetical protein